MELQAQGGQGQGRCRRLGGEQLKAEPQGGRETGLSLSRACTQATAIGCSSSREGQTQPKHGGPVPPQRLSIDSSRLKAFVEHKYSPSPHPNTFIRPHPQLCARLGNPPTPGSSLQKQAARVEDVKRHCWALGDLGVELTPVTYAYPRIQAQTPARSSACSLLDTVCWETHKPTLNTPK